MGRIANTPTPKWEEKPGHWRLRFTFEGVRFDYRTTTIAKTDKRGALAWAAERTHYVSSGEWKEAVTEGADPTAKLHEVAAVYLAQATGGLITKGTAGHRKTMLRAHLVPAFPTLKSITKASLASYQAERLKLVQFATVKKELSCLLQVLKFAESRGWIAELPPFPKRPGKSVGTRHRSAPSGHTKGFTEAHARAMLPHLPRLSRLHRDTGRRWPCRLYFEFLLETGLRPGTLHGLRIGKHWSPGNTDLKISGDIDKNRYERSVPLTPRAVEILTSLAPEADAEGRIFFPRDHREALRKAAAAADLPPEMLATVHQYDFRHARGTQMVNTGLVLAASYALGHKQMTTTNRYSHANEMQAKELVERLSAPSTSSDSGAGSGANSGAETKKGPGGDCSPVPEPYLFPCAKERTRTSTGVTPLAPQESKADPQTAISADLKRNEARLSPPKRKDSGAPPHNSRPLRRGPVPRLLLAAAALKMGVLDQPCGVSL